jgi:WXXGXW repeat (2 copies)
MRNLRLTCLLSGLLLLAVMALAMPSPSFGQVGISITIAPPMLPVYEQPVIPGPGYIWTPGYWAWSPEEAGYYWVPGTWVQPPQVGCLWTPGYWSWAGNSFIWNAGYWGPAVGFYGGVNYGYGYTGDGYMGGYWRNRAFFYNRSVNNITNVNIINVYQRPIPNTLSIHNVSYNGGMGGLNARPTAAQLAASRERHITATLAQLEQGRAASSNRQLFASVNHGKPPIAATSRPGEFSGRGVMAAREAAPYHAAAQAAVNRPASRTEAAAAARRPEVAEHGAPGRAMEPSRMTERSAPPRTANEMARPGTEARPRIESEAARPRTENEMAQPRTENEMTRQRTASEMARPRTENAPPRMESEMPRTSEAPRTAMAQTHRMPEARPAPERRAPAMERMSAPAAHMSAPRPAAAAHPSDEKARQP